MENNIIYRSRNGTDLTIYNMAAGGEWPIHGAYWGGEFWVPKVWREGGVTNPNEEHPLDIDFEKTIIE